MPNIDKIKSFISDNKQTIRDVIITVVITYILFGLCFPIVIVSGRSMVPTLSNGSIIISVSSSIKIPQRGDIIICHTSDKQIIKRVIGIEGDIIDIDKATGHFILNGEILNEDYISLQMLDYGDVNYPIVVDTNSYFVVGDNRNNSHDSRNSDVGQISLNNVKSVYLFSLIK